MSAPATPPRDSATPTPFLPRERPRRLRRTAALRALARESRAHPEMLVQPLFVEEGLVGRSPIGSMPGIERLSVDEAVREVAALAAVGVRAVLLFGVPASKDPEAGAMAREDGVVQRAIRAIKAAHPETLVIADLCACEYTSHGHCGLVNAAGEVENDATLALLARAALTYAAAGVDVVAPSDMMDGRVGHLRDRLDAAGRSDVAIMAYSVKYASAFYGPFREAAGSTPAFGDRRAYQMDPANRREALREARLDLAEAADALIVKPALAYLDIVRDLAERTDVPIAVYSVSGEYAMVKAAAAAGWIDEDRVVDETMTSFVRAGAQIVVSYFAKAYAARHGAS